MNIDSHSVIRRPLITEKSVFAQAATNQYTFEVHPAANKVQIKEAVQSLFDVKVLAVQVSNNNGKMRRTRMGSGRRPDWKKAIVRLADGQQIEGL